ncbi:DMT family transporter, partial [Leisingera sp. ANG-S5]|uniref:DMT family transporter n=1 Tax=Leisingera sp. ANG-S5 TaxID=1577901 RepID=UPI00057D3D9C
FQGSTSWGANFIAIKELIGFTGPISILAVQFLACWLFLPFVKRPKNLHLVALWGVAAGGCQYGFQNIGLDLGASPGIASVLLQLQAFFTPVLLSVLYRKPFALSTIGVLLLGLFGVYLVAAAGRGATATGTVAVLFLVMAAFSWSVGNVTISRIEQKTPDVAMFPVLIYASVFISIPVTIWANATEGMIHHNLVGLTATELVYAAVLIGWILIAYLGGYGIWNYLISRYGGEKIVRFGLLVPVFGLILSYLVYQTQVTALQKAGIALILSALIANRYFDLRSAKAAQQACVVPAE